MLPLLRLPVCFAATACATIQPFGWNQFAIQGHGSHTAGTVGAAGNSGVGVTGVNWKASKFSCSWYAACWMMHGVLLHGGILAISSGTPGIGSRLRTPGARTRLRIDFPWQAGNRRCPCTFAKRPATRGERSGGAFGYPAQRPSPLAQPAGQPSRHRCCCVIARAHGYRQLLLLRGICSCCIALRPPACCTCTHQ